MHWIQNIKSEKHSYLIVWILGIFLLVGAFVNEPKRVGDAHEYVLMQESLLQHGSVDLRLSDVIGLKNIEKKNSSFSFNNILPDLNRGFHEKKYFVHHFVLSESGRYYSIHFFLYSLLSVPARLLLDFIGFDPFLSFQMTNVFFVILTLSYIYFISGLGNYEKHWVAALYLLSGTTYYLFWIHPEIFTSSLFLIALLSLLDKKYIVSALCAAVASMQNPPIALFIPFIVLVYVLHIRFAEVGAMKYGISKYFKLIAGIFFACMISLTPSLFYGYVIGHPNPIVLTDGMDYKYVSLSRFFSLWFDLNQGVILGNAGLYIGVIVTLLILILRPIKEAKKREYLVPLLLFCATIIITLPCLTTGNWNSGSSTFLRYGYWLVMMPLVSFVLMSRNLDATTRSWLMVSVIFIQTGIVLANKVWGNDVPPGRFTGISKSIMYRYPDLYNPVPEIFAERAYGAEHPIDPNRIYAFERKGKVTKLLINSKNANAAELMEGAVKYKPIVKISRYNVDDNWYYLNGRFKKEIITTIISDEKVLYDSNKINWTGWSIPENGFRWSDGNKAMMKFKVDNAERKAGRLLLSVGPFKEKVQHVKIELNGELLFDDVLTEERVLEFPFGNNDVFLKEKNTITYQLPNAAKPISGGDNRMLGIFFKWIEIDYQ